MMHEKLYKRLSQRDQVAVLPKLTGTEKDATGNTGAHSKKGAAGKSRGFVDIKVDLCKGCLLCIEACPPDVLMMSEDLNKMGYHPVRYAGQGCTGCGICFYICPEPGTIRVYKRVNL